MATKSKSTSSTKKKSTTPAKIKKVKPVEQVAEETVVEEAAAPVEELPVIPEPTLEERHGLLNKFVVLNFTETLCGAITENKNLILDAFLNGVPEEKREAYIQEARRDVNVRMITYETILENLDGENGQTLAQYDAITYATFTALKESLQGFENEEINSEIVPLLNYNGQVFIVFREKILMTIAASEKVRKALGDEIVAAICLNQLHFSNAIVDVFMAHVAAWIPSYLGEDEETVVELRNKFLETAGAIIMNLSLKVLTVMLNLISVDPQNVFANIVGQTNLSKYFWGAEINVTMPKAVSVLRIGYIEAEEDDLLNAMAEG